MTRCCHNHKTRYELNVSKNDLFTDSVNMNIHTTLNKFIFFLSNFIFQKAIYTSCILLFSYSVICILNCLLFNVRCVLLHFFHAIVKFCVVFVVGIIKRAIPVKYECTSTEITKLYTTPTTLLSVNEILLLKYMNWSTNFRRLPFKLSSKNII